MGAIDSSGRSDELKQLADVVAAAPAGKGALVFLTGPTGGGKSTLIKALRARVEAGELGELEALAFVCQPSTPYGPFLELLGDLARRNRGKIVASKALAILEGTAPLVLKALPGGELAAAGFTALMKTFESGATMDAVSTQVAEALERIAGEESPLLVILDEAHLLDEGSCEVVRRFVAEGMPPRLVLLLAYDPQRLPPDHALPELRRDAMLGQDGVDVPLAPLEEAGVEAIMRGRWDAVPHPLLAAWLVERSGGSAAWVDRFLAALESAGVVRRSETGVELDGTIARDDQGWQLGGALAGAVVPASLRQLAEIEAELLEEQEQELLRNASIQGELFAGRVLVEMLGAEETEVRKRLEPLVQRRVILYDDDDLWWSERSAVWRFDPRVLQSAFYGAATRAAYDRKQLHSRVADVLEVIVADDPRPPGRILLELARHRREAGQPAAAAEWLLRAAQAATVSGSFRGAYALCRDALELLDGADDDRLRADLTGLLLVSAGSFWDESTRAESAELRALADRGEEAARRLGDPGSLARFLWGRGLLAYVVEGYPEAIRLLREAEGLAEGSFDPVARVLLMTRLGHALDSGEGLGAGLEMLERAQALLKAVAPSPLIDPAELARARGLLSRDVGIAHYDRGDWAAAGPHLEAAVAELAGAAPEDRAWALCFRAQRDEALGHRERAREGIEAALAVLLPGAQTTRAFLLGMRARLELAAGDEERASADAQAALADAVAAIDVTTTALVRILFADVAVGLGRLDEAAAQLELAAEESYGAARVVVGAYTVRARLELARGGPAAAADAAELALAELAANEGAVPFFRSDEVLWWGARAQLADSRDAAETIALAHAAVERRASGLPPEDEASYRATPVAAGIAALAPAASAAG